MPDQFTEISSASWFGRIGESIKGFIFGFLLIPVAIFLLFWNESRSVTTAKSLKEGAAAVVSVDAATVAPANELKLVHVSGQATTTDVVSDPEFGISATAIRLIRTVEMYQWDEKEKTKTNKNVGGSKETVKTWTYEKTWSSDRIDSSKFKHPQDHSNPGQMIAQSSTFTAPGVTLGAFNVPAGIIDKMKGDVPIVPTNADLANLKPEWKSKVKASGEGFYFGADPSIPAIGDQRVTFKVLKPAVFSVLAQQVGDTFAPYSTKAGRNIERVESGAVSAKEMFQHAASENSMLTWGLRFGGFILMAFGIGLILSPISVFADVIPFVGTIIGAGVTLAAMLLALFGSLTTIAIAWFVVRPVLGVVLISLALGALFFGKYFASMRSAATASR